MNHEEKSFLEHLEELRQRLIKCLIAVGVAFGVCYFFSKEILDFLMVPLKRSMPEGTTAIFLNPAEAFLTYIKLSLYSAIFFSSPYILYQTWLFIAPGLYVHEKRMVLPFMIGGISLFVVGVAFAYFVVFPFGLKFLFSFATDFIRPAPRLKDYLSFTATLLLAFGAVFELPIFVFFLTKMGIIDEKTLSKNRRYAILVIFIIAAILTPPDVFTQLLMAGPLLLLYEISIWVAKLARGKSTDQTKR